MEVSRVALDSVDVKESGRDNIIFCDALDQVFPRNFRNLTEVAAKIGILTFFQFKVYQNCKGAYNIRQIADLVSEDIPKVLSAINVLIHYGYLTVRLQSQDCEAVVELNANNCEDSPLAWVD